MSDQELGKKLVEEEVVDHFIAAYTHATGTGLAVVEPSERPDFLCKRDDGSRCGLELVEIRRDPQAAWAHRVAFKSDTMPPDEAAHLIHVHVTAKELKRRQPDWKLPADTILVVQMSECPLGELEPELHRWLCEDLTDSGFGEIWIADYTAIEAFREIELFCVLPEEWRDRYPRAHPFRKPYG